MRYTYEERDRLVTDYANRTGITKDKASELFTYGKLVETRRKNTHLTPKKKKRK